VLLLPTVALADNGDVLRGQRARRRAIPTTLSSENRAASLYL